MTSKEFLDLYIEDQSGTLARFMDNEPFYFKMVHLFLNDQSMSGLREHMNAGDLAAAFRDAHTLKGVSGNMGFAKLTEVSTALTEVLRNPPYDEAKAIELFALTEEAYTEVTSSIEELDS